MHHPISGDGFAEPLLLEDYLIVHYRDSIDGEIQYHNLGVVYPNEKAEEWCVLNNKIYAGFHRSETKDTSAYDAKGFLATLNAPKPI